MLMHRTPTIRPQRCPGDLGEAFAGVNVLHHRFIHPSEMLVALLQHGTQAIGHAYGTHAADCVCSDMDRQRLPKRAQGTKIFCKQALGR